MRGPWPRRDWTDRPTEPGRPDGMEARLAALNGPGSYPEWLTDDDDRERYDRGMVVKGPEGQMSWRTEQGRLLDEHLIPLAIPDRPEVQLPRDALDTSARAAQLALPKTGTQRMRILEGIAAAGPYGSTDAELEIELRMSGNSVRPRRGELVEQGWIADSGQRRRHPHHDGEYAVWKLTEAGRQAYSRLIEDR